MLPEPTPDDIFLDFEFNRFASIGLKVRVLVVRFRRWLPDSHPATPDKIQATAVAADRVGILFGIKMVFSGWALVFLGRAAKEVAGAAAEEPAEKPAEGPT